MPTPRTPLAPDPSKTQAQLQQLSAAAKSLNELSDQLTKYIGEIETTLNKISIGITANVNTEVWSDENGLHVTTWRIAYEKTAKQWGFVIERVDTDHTDPFADKDESWVFKDAPREHRLKAVEKIPELLDALLEKAKEVAADITGKVSFAKNLAINLSQSPTGGSAPTK